MRRRTLIYLVVVGIALVLTLFRKPATAPPSQLPIPTSSVPNTTQTQDMPAETMLASGLDTPWAIAFLPNGSLLVTERPGRVRLVTKDGLRPAPIVTITKAQEIGEGGLLGIALHPNFSSNNFVYLYYTYSNAGDNTLNRVVRMTYKNDSLQDEKIIVDAIPGASNHNGGRIQFGPDNFLYITTGDAQEPSQAQNTETLGGKILRVTDEGKPAPSNPFGNLVYSYGHRNPQGIVWDGSGTLWETEHGRSGILSGLDELNSIAGGKNYGWPTIQGTETRESMVTPRLNSGGSTWAPAGLAFLDNALYFGGLRGQGIYKVTLPDLTITHYKEQFGRVREVIVGPDKMLYISTSNNDGRGIPKEGDDKIIRISPQTLQ